MFLLKKSVFFVLLLLVFSNPSYGQEIPSNIEVSVVDQNIQIAWEGDSEVYEIQTTSSLDGVDWFPTLITSNQSAAIPFEGERMFFRVGTGNALPVDGEVSDDRRFEILEDISDYIQTQSVGDPEIDNKALVSFLSQYSEIDVVGRSSESSVYANFIDGIPLHILNNRNYEAADETTDTIDLTASDTQVPDLSAFEDSGLVEMQRAFFGEETSVLQADESSQGLPDSDLAVLVQAQGIGIDKPMLQYLVPAFLENNYDVGEYGASVEDFIELGELPEIGVFYVDSHGGVIATREKTRIDDHTVYFKRGEQFVIATSTLLTRENWDIYKPMVESGELALASPGDDLVKGIRFENDLKPEPLPDPVPLAIYTITGKFIKNRLKFGKNSFVYIDTCSGTHPWAKSFREDCFAAGAGSYAGWSTKVSDKYAFVYTTRVLFDALLGGSPIYETVPRQRPFDLNSVLKFMSEKNYLRDIWVYKGKLWDAQFLLYPSPEEFANGQFSLLNPSLRNMFIDEDKEEVQVFGLFDPDQEIKINVEGNGSTEIFPILDSVTKNQLKFSLPAQTQPSAGWITILQNERTSNSVPITQWMLDVNHNKHFTVNVSEPVVKYNYKLYFRGDIHPFRTLPYRDQVRAGSSLHMEATRQSTGKVLSASGTWTYPDTEDTQRWELANGPVDLPTAFLDRPTAYMLPRLTLAFDGTYNLSVSTRAPDALRTITTISGEETTDERDPAGTIFSPSQINGSWDGETYQLNANNNFVNDLNGADWGAAPAMWEPDDSVPAYAE